MDRRNNFYKNIISYALFNLLSPLLSFVTRTAFIYLLGIQYVGITGLFTDILNLLSLAELGISGSITYALYKPLSENNQEKIADLMAFFRNCYTIIGFVILIIGSSLIPFVPKLISSDINININIRLIYCLYLMNTVVSYWFFSYRIVLLTAAQQEYKKKKYDILGSLAINVILWITLFFTRNFLLYLIFQICLNIILSAVTARMINCIFPFAFKKKKSNLQRNEKKGIWKLVYVIFLDKIGYTLFTSTDSTIISSVISTIQVGILGNYKTIVSLITKVIGIFSTNMLPAVGDFVASNSNDENQARFEKYNFINNWMVSIASLMLLVGLQPCITVWTGKENVAAISIAVVISLNFYLDLILGMVYQFRAAYGLYDKGKYLRIITSILNIPISIYWAKIWGMFGVLFATSVLNMATWAYPFFLYKYGFKSSSKNYYLELIIHTFVTFCLGAAFFYIQNKIQNTNFVLLFFISEIIVFIIGNSVFVLVYHSKPEFKKMLTEFSRLNEDIKHYINKE